MVEVALGKNVFEARHIDSGICELCAVSGECSCRYQVCGLFCFRRKIFQLSFVVPLVRSLPVSQHLVWVISLFRWDWDKLSCFGIFDLEWYIRNRQVGFWCPVWFYLGSSSFPPEHQSKSFHACASVCMLDIIVSKGNSVCGLKLLYVPVLLSTKPTIKIDTCSVPSGFMKVAPEAMALWTLHSVDDMKSHIPGELPLPCPLP